MTSVDLVIFDCDGVLVDSEIIAAGVLADELTLLGLPCSPEECVERYTGIRMSSIRADIEATLGRSLPDFEATIRTRDAAAFEIALRAIDGVADAIAHIAQPCCVASSGALSKIIHSLTLTGLLPLFEKRLFSAEQVARGKPAPDLFLHAARALGAAPERTAVVEDAVAGVRAGVAAGMRVLGFAGASHCGPGWADALAAAGASVVFDQMAALPALIEASDAASG